MIVVGIGFLLAFLKDYALSSVSYNFLGAILTMEWSMLVIGFSKPQCVVGTQWLTINRHTRLPMFTGPQC